MPNSCPGYAFYVEQCSTERDSGKVTKRAQLQPCGQVWGATEDPEVSVPGLSHSLPSNRPLLASGSVFSSMKHLPLHGSTSFWRSGALVLLLFLSLEQTSASYTAKIKQKVGECPSKRLECGSRVPNPCTTDFSCEAHFKCCPFSCGNLCIDPYEEPCMLPSDAGDCHDNQTRWYFDSEKHYCRPFTYSGCHGNSNNFLSKMDCKNACMLIVKKGQCPLFPFQMRMECPPSCKNDMDCLEKEKCCESRCGFICARAWLVKTGFCPSKPMICSKIDKPKCLKDNDCPLDEKCCSRCGLKCLEAKH
ncbi:WAP four-disulfide core domain protein 8 [Alexandromys fortis]|uniref:WAP four-disulfide core domain protein 8 n=1 Tax=Alexandromys fortis TaxID=100897 RepID=UPI00215337B3|nr:WAP four-disulfide core domain protein 8 [Microtus fortis]